MLLRFVIFMFSASIKSVLCKRHHPYLGLTSRQVVGPTQYPPNGQARHVQLFLFVDESSKYWFTKSQSVLTRCVVLIHPVACSLGILPSSHSLQLGSPFSLECFPLGQRVQFPGMEPYWPMLQKEQEVEPSLVVVSPSLHWMHLDKSISSSDLFHPTGHLTQPLAVAAIVTSIPYLPTIHFEQEDSPVVSVNCPRTQLVQVLAPALDTVPTSHGSQTVLLAAP